VTYLLLAAGLAGLLIGADAMVRGASGLARVLGISPLVIGLTVVAFGTSAPELVVNVIGAIEGETDIAFGNVVGSNLANLGLVLGLSALMAPLAVEGQIVRREVPLLVLASAMLLVLASDAWLRGVPSALDRADGLTLLLLFCMFLYVMAGDVIRARGKDVLFEHIGGVRRFQSAAPMSLSLVQVAIGLGLLYLGGRYTIESGVAIAAALGLSPAVIGISVVAIGTSLPELVTSVLAAVRREPDLAVGNLVGSNLFNGLFVLPASALIADLAIPAGGMLDLVLGLLLAALLVPVSMLGHGRIGRLWGAVLLFMYAGYLAVRLAGS
jgi:cation:H+ antiporter